MILRSGNILAACLAVVVMSSALAAQTRSCAEEQERELAGGATERYVVLGSPLRVFLGYTNVGAPVVHARVRLYDAKAKLVAEKRSDEHGMVVFPQAQPGEYMVSFAEEGYVPDSIWAKLQAGNGAQSCFVVDREPQPQKVSIEKLLKYPQKYAHMLVDVEACAKTGTETIVLVSCSNIKHDPIWLNFPSMYFDWKLYRMDRFKNMQVPANADVLFAINADDADELVKALRFNGVFPVHVIGQFETTTAGKRFGHMDAYNHLLILKQLVHASGGAAAK